MDASFFLEIFIKPPKKRKLLWKKECREYLQYKVGKRYRSTISLLALGEIVKVIASVKKQQDWETQRERSEIFMNLLTILEQKEIQFWSPQFGCMKKAL